MVEIDGETIIYDPDAELLHHLDLVATTIWRTLDGSETLGELASGLAAQFETDVRVVSDDVVRLARQLAADGLLTTVPR